MMRLLSSVAALCAAVVSAHLCTLNPIQRGQDLSGASVSHANECFLLTGPCGGQPAGKPTGAYPVGGSVHVELLKNGNHFMASAPGNFSVFLWDASGNSTLLGLVQDTAAPDQSLYSVSAELPPSAGPGDYVLQAIYAPNNPAAPAAFYQCSDIQIF